MKKVKKILLCAFFTAAALCTLAACGSEDVTVTFDGNGGTLAKAEATASSGAQLPAVPAPTRAGYVFTGWFTDSACSEGSRWNADMRVEGAVTLYAGWEAESLLTLSYDLRLNSGETVSNAPQESKLKSGSLAFEPTSPVREGYRFLGWCKDEDCTEEFDFSTQKITTATTVYAKWIRICTVSVKTADNRTVQSKLDEGSLVSALPLPTEEDELFIGYYKEATYQTRVEFSDEITEDITLYAKTVAPTDTSLYNLTVEQSWDTYGRAYISTQEPLDELVLPAKYNGYTIREVNFREYEPEQSQDDDGEPQRNRLQVKTLVLPSCVENVNLGRNTEIENFEVEYSSGSEARYFTYDGCLYYKSGNQVDTGNGMWEMVYTYLLSDVPSLRKVVNLMPEAVFSYGVDNSKVYCYNSAPSETLIREGLNGNGVVVLVPAQHLAAYNALQSLNNNISGVTFYNAEFYDETNDIIADGTTLLRYLGESTYDEPAVIGVDDGITEIGQYGLNGVSYVTIGAGVTSMSSETNSQSYYGGNITFLGACPNGVNFENLRNFYTVFIPFEYWQSYRDNGIDIIYNYRVVTSDGIVHETWDQSWVDYYLQQGGDN